MIAEPLEQIESEVVACRRCPRLVRWREEAARRAPRRFQGEKYWSRPLPAFGDGHPRVLIVGLAPAANGGNRTGRFFTGDESGNFLFEALHAVDVRHGAAAVQVPADNDQRAVAPGGLLGGEPQGAAASARQLLT